MISLLLLRHAHAGDPARWSGDDDARPLSEKGRRQAERLGRLLAATAEGPDLILTSPKVRAAETAGIVAEAVGVRVIVDERLGGPLDAGVVGEILRDAGAAERPCLVGHDPDFTELLGQLLGADAVTMRKATLARVDLPGRTLEPGEGVLRYLLPPELVPGR